jgi:hypothetical protein
MAIWLSIVIIIAQCFSIATADASKPTLIIVDSHVGSFGEFVKACCHRYDVNVIDVPSSNGEAGFVDATTSNGSKLRVGEITHDVDKSCAFCLSMSDNGLKLSEHIQKRLNLVGNRVSNILEDDYLVNDKLDQNGLDAIQQQLVLTWDDLKEFLDTINHSSASDKPLCVMKVPDVLSHGTTTTVCHDQNEAKYLLEKLRGMGVNEEILVQEFVDGQEYRVETMVRLCFYPWFSYINVCLISMFRRAKMEKSRSLPFGNIIHRLPMKPPFRRFDNVKSSYRESQWKAKCSEAIALMH